MMHTEIKTLIRKTFLACMLLLLLPGLQPAYADQTVRLVTGNDYQPFTDQSLPQGGMITAVVDHIFRKMGYLPEIEFHSWSRGYKLAEQTAFLGTFPYVRTPERMKDFHFSDPIYTIVSRFFVRAGAATTYTQNTDLKGLTACKPLGYHLSDIQVFLDQDILELYRPNNMASCFQMLRLGRVDLVPINEHVGWAVARQIAAEDDVFRVLDKHLKEAGLHFIVSQKHPQALEILERFNTILRQMKDDGSLDGIIGQYIRHKAIICDF